MSGSKNKFSTLFFNHCKKYPKKILVVDEKTNVEFSYNESYELIQRINRFLLKNKVQSGDTITSGLPNCIENLFIFLTCMLFGYNYSALPENFSEYEKKKLLKIVNPQLVFLNQITTHQNKSGEISISLDSNFLWVPKIKEKKEFSDIDSKIFILSSGTTGEPKVITQNINNLILNGKEFLKNHNFVNSESVFLNYLSMSYLGGLYNLLIIPIIANSKIIITGSFSGVTFLNIWKIIERFRINCLWLVPSIIKGILKIHLKNSFVIKNKINKFLKYCFVGTAPLDHKTKKLFQDKFGILLLENYGLSETLFISSENLTSKKNYNTKTTGFLLDKVKLKFGNYNKKFSNILVKTPSLFEGYISEDGISNKNLETDGYFNTGDIGYKKNGKLIIVGREKDIIKKGGFLVNLIEIELVTSKIKGVFEAAAVKVDDDFYGETSVVFFTNQKKLENKEKENIEFKIFQDITSSLAKQKWPKKVFHMEKLPKTRSGKISKFQLKQIYEKSIIK
tara:strand:- start:32765 stop:34285 length:1521 start_codon:yes stop_codon:yes gene_type:complete